jgi:hypothetical protein
MMYSINTFTSMNRTQRQKILLSKNEESRAVFSKKNGLLEKKEKFTHKKIKESKRLSKHSSA